MRLIQVTLPPGRREPVLAALDDEGVDYVVSEEASGREYEAIVYFPLPTNAVEPVLDSLREAGLDESAYTVIIEAETVISRQFDELAARYEEDGEADADRIAREELAAHARDLAPEISTYVVMTALSAVIATAGLLLDSPAIVVGSMVIAPLIGPAMATSVGTVIRDREMFARGVRLQVVGLVIAVVGSAVFAATLKTAYLVPPGTEITQIGEIQERLLPDFLSLAVALGAGIAGVVSLTSGVSAALVGVMIAAALMPPAATVGIGIAWGRPTVTVGAFVLALVNWLSINLAALATLWHRGYRPLRWFQQDRARSATVTRIAVLLIGIAVLSAFLGAVTYSSYQSGTFETDARTATEAVLDEPTYDRLTLLSFNVNYTSQVVFQDPSSVVVRVGRPSSQDYPGLPERIDRQITAVTGRNVTVEVHFVEVARD